MLCSVMSNDHKATEKSFHEKNGDSTFIGAQILISCIITAKQGLFKCLSGFVRKSFVELNKSRLIYIENIINLLSSHFQLL